MPAKCSHEQCKFGEDGKPAYALPGVAKLCSWCKPLTELAALRGKPRAAILRSLENMADASRRERCLRRLDDAGAIGTEMRPELGALSIRRRLSGDTPDAA